MDMNQLVKNVVLTKVCSIKPSGDSTESKQITLKVNFNGVQLGDVFTKAVSQSVIQWQNGQGRKHFDTWVNNQVVEIDFKSPARQPQIDPMTALLNDARAQGVNVDDKDELTKFIMAKMEKTN